MNKIAQWLPMLLMICFGFIACSNVVNSAHGKTERESSRKTNSKMEEVFNSKDEQRDSPPTSTRDNNNNDAVSTPVNAPEAQVKPRNSDFVAGTKVIFADGPRGEQVGEFPSKWDLKMGTVEVMEFGEEQVIGFLSKGIIFPLMDTEHYLPEKFTIEIDCYFHDRGNEGYYLQFNGGKYKIRISIDNVNAGNTKQRTKVKERKGWRRVQLSFNKRALKVYYEGKRLINIPRLKIKPTSVEVRALSHNSSKNKYAMFKNFRLAEGAVPLYDRLLTDGKIVTNDIHFDRNEANLKSQSMSIIEEVVKMMLEYPDLKLSVEGHTDSDGTEAFNLDLSERRAEAVKAAMIERGVASDRLLTKGHGESVAIDNNGSEVGKAQNRRVEFVKINP